MDYLFIGKEFEVSVLSSFAHSALVLCLLQIIVYCVVVIGLFICILFIDLLLRVFRRVSAIGNRVPENDGNRNP